MLSHNPQLGTVGLPVFATPRLTSGMAQELEQLPRRRLTATAAGQLLYVPRLGVTALPHTPNHGRGGGWICTVAAATGSGRLPVGAFVLCDLEIETAIGTANPTAPLDTVTAAEYATAWRLRVLDWHGAAVAVALAVADLADLSEHAIPFPTVTVSPEALHALQLRLRVLRPYGVHRRLAELVTAGFLVDVTPDQAADSAVYALKVPPASWWATSSSAGAAG